MISVFDVTHGKSNDHVQSFWDALARHVASNYNDTSYKSVAINQFMVEYQNCLKDRIEMSKYVHDFYNRLKSRQELNVNVFNEKEVISFIATYLKCVFIMTQVVTNGLGYMITDAIFGDGVSRVVPPEYYVFVSVDDDRFDTLHARSYMEDLDGSRELPHKLAIDEVVYAWLTRHVVDAATGSATANALDAVADPVISNALDAVADPVIENVLDTVADPVISNVHNDKKGEVADISFIIWFNYLTTITLHSFIIN